jgi:hypothetical protein
MPWMGDVTRLACAAISSVDAELSSTTAVGIWPSE